MNINLSKIEARLTTKQKREYSYFSTDAQRMQYLLSFIGLNKTKPHVFRTRENVVVKTLGAKVHENRNEILSIMRERCNPFRDKTPTDKTESWIGVEIECFLYKNDFNGERECICECDCIPTCGECGREHDNPECTGECRDNCECGGSYIESVGHAVKRAAISGVTVVSDGSLRHDDLDYFGVEFKILYKQDNDKNLKKLCVWLASHNAIVNTTCGLHVHLDHRSLKLAHRVDQTEVAAKYARAMKFLALMLPESRQNNTYCRPGYSFEERYRQVNASALAELGTIEIRAHSGTVSYEKISNWVRILTAVKTTHYHLSTESLDVFLSYIALSPELNSYVRERIQKFNPHYTLTSTAACESVCDEESEVA